MDEQLTLKELYENAESQRQSLENFNNTSSDVYQHDLARTLSLHETCQARVDGIGLFSANENVEEIASFDLKYMIMSKYQQGSRTS